MRSTCIFLFAALAAFSCTRKEAGFDAAGHFEADEYLVASETGGRIIRLNLLEGDRVNRGDTIALTDTLSLSLQILQSLAQQAAIEAKIPGIKAQEKVVDTEIAILVQERKRFEVLLSEKATSGKSLDDIVHQIELAHARKAAFSAQVAGLRQEERVVEAQRAILMDQIRKCAVIAPADGVVISLVSKQGDIMVPGKVIVKLADIDRIILKAYVSGDQLSRVKIAGEVTARIDAPAGGYLQYPGQVYWVADQAEFTPKVIQTRKERVNLVYAVKVRVKNDGRIKIGMPGELLFADE